MQASLQWTPPGGVLGRLVGGAHARAAALEPRRGELESTNPGAPPPSLAAALSGPEVAVIAEIKRRSPSRGAINLAVHAGALASTFERGGASALSVLTEPNEFGGASEDLLEVRVAVSLAIIKKDFHVAPIQLIEARALGASAALLIARALPPDLLREMTATARELGLETIVEVRSEAELERALEAGARIVGVNNRNLETLAIDMTTAERLIPIIPRDVIAIAESGVHSRADVERAAERGANAVLVGTALSGSADAERALRALTGVPRTARA